MALEKSELVTIKSVLDIATSTEVVLLDMDHGKTLATPAVGSHNTATEKPIITAAGSGLKNKVFLIVLSTLVTGANIVQLLDGTGGSAIFEIEFGTGLQGCVVPLNIPSQSCESTANTAIYLKLSAAQKVTYHVCAWKEA